MNEDDRDGEDDKHKNQKHNYGTKRTLDQHSKQEGTVVRNDGALDGTSSIIFSGKSYLETYDNYNFEFRRSKEYGNSITVMTEKSKVETDTGRSRREESSSRGSMEEEIYLHQSQDGFSSKLGPWN